ncbi:dermonecrotic toxin domain-containing protein [Pseudomonas sp.]|uniref:dermonecrotic toxin domain-containing protein n=2 Tax=Pseudomonas sp. TaxID=306 RepID=UPI0028B02D49|nr:DUF6543 domain-containing protein [Pseudomonas sp.]
MVTDNEQARQSDVIAQLQGFQDELIARRLPAWLKRLNPEHFALLGEALQAGLAARYQLSAIFSRVQDIDRFAEQQLAGRLQLTTPVDQLYLRQWYDYASPSKSYFTSRLPTLERDWYDTSLLWAAMQNFTADHVVAKADCVVNASGSTIDSLSAKAFVQACRSLDIGGKYREHLQSTLEAPPQEGQQGFAALLESQIRSMMLVDAFKAHVDGVLRDAHLQWVIDLYRQGSPGPFAERPVVARQLEAFGCQLQQIVVFDVVNEGWLRNTSLCVLVYIPADPVAPWSISEDLEQFARKVLGRRLRDKAYQQFFRRFVRRRDSQHFFSSVQERLGDLASFATRSLDQHMKAYPEPLFSALAIARITQIKDDAAMIAVPVAEIDLAAQLSHDQRLEAEGWSGLVLASLFVPQLGVILLAVMAWELLDETFEAVKDWREGDSAAALDHLVNVGKTAAWVAAVSAGSVAVREAWQRAVVVDDMVPAVLGDGTEKLWNQDLAPYVSAPPPAQAQLDASGVYRLGDECWIEMAGAYYKVWQEADGDWFLNPYGNHSPQLDHNGAGAWRLWSEQPADWSDTHQLFNRLGGACASLPRHLIEHVLAVHGLDDEALRALHVFDQAPEVELIDTVDRFAIAARVTDLEQRLRAGAVIEDQALLHSARALADEQGVAHDALAQVVADHRRQLFQVLYARTDTIDQATVPLRQAFTSLHRLAAQQVLEQASEAQRTLMADSQRVPLAMALAARERVVRIRVARAGEGLWIDVPQTLDFARAVVKLVQGMPGVAPDKHWQVRDAHGQWAAPASDSPAGALSVMYQEGAFWLRDAKGTDLGAPGELFETLADSFSAQERAAMAIGEPFAANLRLAVAEQWRVRRQEVEDLFSADQPAPSFLLPKRLPDGRLGYPLSGGRGLFGRGRPAAFEARLRWLCPDVTAAQADRWLNAAGADNASTALDELERQFKVLRTTLTHWQRLGVVRLEWLARYGLRKTLISRWRYAVLGKFLDLELPSAIWDIGLGLGQLPDLPEPIVFPHITQLALRDSELRAMPDGFLRAFPNLKALELTNGDLRKFSLPAFLRAQLTSLDLSGNKIVLDAGQVEQLENCTALLYLNLSNNPLQAGFSVDKMPELRSLLLRSTRLRALPAGVTTHATLSRLEITDSSIGPLPSGFWTSRIWQTGRVRTGARDEAARHWHDPEDVLNPVPARYQWEDAVDEEDRDDLASLWQFLEEQPGSHNFFNLLKVLASSEEFAHDNGAYQLAYRMYDMMNTIREDGDLIVVTDSELARIVDSKLARGLTQEQALVEAREESAFRAQLFSLSEIDGCGDDAISRFTDLELYIKTWRLLRDTGNPLTEVQLLEKGGQFWRLEQLDDFSRKQAYALDLGAQLVDVELLYRMKLFDDLQLPIRRPEMRFEQALQLQASRDEALNYIRARQTVPVMARWFCDQSWWRQYLERTSPARLQLPASKRIEKDLLHENDDVEGMQAFNVWEAGWLLEQRMTLTEEAMQRAVHAWNIYIP